MIHNNEIVRSGWKGYEKVLFRIAFVFFTVMCIPTNLDWYKHFVEIDWTNLHFRDLYHIARFEPSFVRLSGEARHGLSGFTNWGILLFISVVVAAIWSFLDRKRTEYNTLYYWLQVIVRYRAAIGIIGFCWEKVFPMQMPYPSISLLNNDFGDMTGHKIYWLSIAIVPWYQSFTGLVEFAGGALLLFRKTVLYGAALLIGALSAVGVVNIAYGNASHVYAFFFALAGAFLLIPYAKPLYRLLIEEKFSQAKIYVPPFDTAWKRITRFTLKAGVFYLFVFLFAYLTLLSYLYDPYKQPPIKGVAGLKGYYDVTDFRINGNSIPYSPLDSVPWKEAIFEKWPSLAFRTNRTVQLDLSNGGGYDSDHSMRSIGRAFELSGIAGGRRIFHYYADTVNKVLYLLDKNIPHRNIRGNKIHPIDTVYDENWISQEAWKNIGDERTAIHPRAGSTLRDKAFAKKDEVDRERKKMILTYELNADGSEVVLSGTDENRDSLYIILNRRDRAYALSESTLSAGQY